MPGEVLRLNAVKIAPAVTKNQEIEVILTRGALKVSNVVRITKDASIGETIDVVSVDSGRKLQAKVVAVGRVEML